MGTNKIQSIFLLSKIWNRCSFSLKYAWSIMHQGLSLMVQSALLIFHLRIAAVTWKCIQRQRFFIWAWFLQTFISIWPACWDFTTSFFLILPFKLANSLMTQQFHYPYDLPEYKCCWFCCWYLFVQTIQWTTGLEFYS